MTDAKTSLHAMINVTTKPNFDIFFNLLMFQFCIVDIFANLEIVKEFEI